jgi:triacylglycerol lipase
MVTLSGIVAMALAFLVPPSATASAQLSSVTTTTADRPTIVLLHGLIRTPKSMQTMARALEGRGYTVVNIGYPSRREPIAALARHVADSIGRRIPSGRIHIVGHSLGGVLVRVAVANGLLDAARIDRVVMLGTPNRGTELVDRLQRNAATRWLLRTTMGVAGTELGTEPTGIMARLPRVPFETGVIAGSATDNPFFSLLLPGPDDGRVTVDRARVEGMRELIVLPYSHPFLMRRRAVIEATIRFLETGRFAG